MLFGKKPNFKNKELQVMANAARLLSIDQVQAAKSGHPGAPLGMADAVTTLFANHLRFDPSHPDWSERDRFILSAGHASALLYSILHLSGYDFSTPDLRKFRQTGSNTPGHPERDLPRGVEMSTGSLGQGFASAVGIAMAEKIRRARGDAKDGYRTYVMCSDGDIMEGIVTEAASLAGLYKLDRLTVMWDNNKISIDGTAALREDVPAKFLALGWAVVEINGHSFCEINRALRIAKRTKKPTLISCKTHIGYKSPLQGSNKVHGSPFSDEDYAKTAVALGRKKGEIPFTISSDAKALWGKVKEAHSTMGRFSTRSLPESPALFGLNPKSLNLVGEFSTRELASKILSTAVSGSKGNIIGGSADVEESTGVWTRSSVDITPDNAKGNFIKYGVREHAMAAIMNGLCMSGFRSYGSTFLVFSDYMRPAIRMAAMMGLPTVFIFSHDSIAAGEDGPSHQPIEQLPSLRLIPNLNVMRPGNAAELAVCLESAFNSKYSPSAIILSRQKFKMSGAYNDNIRRGGYLFAEADGERKVTLAATGSELPLAMSVREELQEKGIGTAVVSMPDFGRFIQNGSEYINSVLRPNDSKTVVIEATGAGYNWNAMFDAQINVGDLRYGMSGKGSEIYNKFGFNSSVIAVQIMHKLFPLPSEAEVAKWDDANIQKIMRKYGVQAKYGTMIGDAAISYFVARPETYGNDGVLLMISVDLSAGSIDRSLQDMSEAESKVNELISETLDPGLKIQIVKIVLAPYSTTGKSESDEVHIAKNTDEFEQLVKRFSVKGRNYSQEDFKAFSDYVDTIIDYFKRKNV